jgi:hypothetical protein
VRAARSRTERGSGACESGEEAGSARAVFRGWAKSGAPAQLGKEIVFLFIFQFFFKIFKR